MEVTCAVYVFLNISTTLARSLFNRGRTQNEERKERESGEYDEEEEDKGTRERDDNQE